MQLITDRAWREDVLSLGFSAEVPKCILAVSIMFQRVALLDWCLSNSSSESLCARSWHWFPATKFPRSPYGDGVGTFVVFFGAPIVDDGYAEWGDLRRYFQELGSVLACPRQGGHWLFSLLSGDLPQEHSSSRSAAGLKAKDA